MSVEIGSIADVSLIKASYHFVNPKISPALITIAEILISSNLNHVRLDDELHGQNHRHRD